MDLVGARPDRAYSTSTDRVLLTLGGSVADLDRLEGSTLVATLDVTGPRAGHDRRPGRRRPAGGRRARVSASPNRVAVTVDPVTVADRRRPVAPRRRQPERLSGHVPPLRYRRHPRCRQRRSQAADGLRPRPGDRQAAGGPGRQHRRRARTPVARATCSSRPSRPARRAWAWTSMSSASCPHRPSRSWRGTARTRPASWSRPRTTRPTTTASRCSMPMASSSTTRSRRSSRRSSGVRASSAASATRNSAGPWTRAWEVDAYREHRVGLAGSIDASGLHIVLDGANGSGGALGPGILEATGARVEAIHVEPDGININVESGATAPASLAAAVVGARGGRRVRARRRRRPPDRGRRARPRRRRRPGAGHPRARAPLARRVAGWPRRLDPVQRRPAARRRGGRWRGRPHARRRQVHPRGHAGLGGDPGRREVRPRDRARAHDVGRRHRDRPRGPARDDRARAVPRGPGRGHPDAAPAAARRPGAPQGPVGGRCGPSPRDRRGLVAAGRCRARARPAIRHGTRPAGHGRGRRRSARVASWPTRSRPSRRSV